MSACEGLTAQDPQKGGTSVCMKPKSARMIEEHQLQRETRPRRAPTKKYDKYL